MILLLIAAVLLCLAISWLIAERLTAPRQLPPERLADTLRSDDADLLAQD